MDIVNNFKAYLQASRSNPSKVTVKNYVSDVRKFVQWYEKTYNLPFIGSEFTSSVLQAFQEEMDRTTQGVSPAARSTKRYISSLRKFCRFLSDSGAIKANPFEAVAQQPKLPDDPWEIKPFKSFLFSQNISKLTVKNYILDVQQFLSWLEMVTEAKEKGDFLTIDHETVEQYKERMLNDANFSATSVNRKLSSLRRYMRWLHERGLLKAEEVIEEVPVEPEVVAPTPVVEAAPLPLTALHLLDNEEPEEDETVYSPFAPVRLAQKSTKLASMIILTPLSKAAEAIHYAIWKSSERNIFAPVKTILEEAAHLPMPTTTEEVVAPATVAASNLTSAIAKKASIFGNYVRVKAELKPYAVRNISKSFYAPLHISLNEFTWWQKVIYHARYTRPIWYKRYHSHPIAHHIHFAILIFATAIAAFATYQVATDNPYQNQAVMAASLAPPRTLAFQGRLLDRTNTPITAETTLRFGVYKSPTATGSALLWQEVQDVKPNDNGQFSAVLGRNRALSQDLFNDNQNLYVGVTVGQSDELQPRQHFPTTGYASNSQTLEGLKPITDDSSQTQNVVLALDSVGNLTIGGTASPKFQATGGQFSLSGQTLSLATNPGSNGNIELTPDGSGIIDMQGPIQNTTNYNNQSGVLGAVEVDDLLAVSAGSASQSALTVKQNSTGDIISAYSNGIAKFRLDGSGNGTYEGNLTVNGNTINSDSTSFGIVNTNVTNLSIGTSATSLSLGGFSGGTTINNNLTVRGSTTVAGQLSANGGISIPTGKTLSLADFAPGAIPFISGTNTLTQDASKFSWDDGAASLKVTGSLCLTSTAQTCAGSTAGTIYASNATVQAADLAENYTSAQQLEAGDIVVPEGLYNSSAIVKSSQSYQKQIIGIVSTKPGFTLNSDVKADSQHPNVYPLALQGRVTVKVSTINGAIQAGDPLTSSSIPGVAMKATKPGQIVAKALESYDVSDSNSVGKIMAFVNITYQNTESTITDGGNLSLAKQEGIQTVGDDNLSITNEGNQYHATGLFGKLQTMVLEATDTIIIQGQSLKDYIAGVVDDITGQTPTKMSKFDSSLATNSASSSATIAPTQTTASSSADTLSVASGSASLPTASAAATPTPYTIINNATNSAIPTPVASDSATADPTEQTDADFSSFLDRTIKTNYMNSASLSGQLTQVSNLQADFATFSQGLIALGPTSMTDAGVSDMLAIGSNLQLTTNAINTVGSDLNIQPLRQGNVLFMGGLVAINTQGDLNVNGNADFAKDVTVEGKLATNVIAPIPGGDLVVKLGDTNQGNSSLVVHDSNNANVMNVDQQGDLQASGSGSFANLKIVRGVQADTSVTETHADGSAGNGIIHAHQTARTIFTPYVSKNALVYVTATSNTQNVSLFVARQTPQDPTTGTIGSFTVQIPNAMTKDITFNWWIVN